MKTGRNDPCHCGSGQKYKKCHLASDDAARSAELAAAAVAAAEVQAKADAAAAEAAETDEKDKGAVEPGERPRAKNAGGSAPKAAPRQPQPFRRKAV